MSRRQFLQVAGGALVASALPYSWFRQSVQARPAAGGQIIADHTVVDAYSTIPQQYIDIVKQWLVSFSGESHSTGYRYGMNLLAAQESRFAVETFAAYSDPPTHDPTHPKLRFGGLRRTDWGGWSGSTGEGTFFTNEQARTWIKNTIQYCDQINNPLAVIGFAWCWDTCWTNVPDSGSTPNVLDPVYGIHWCGASVDGPEGDRRWGLDSADQALTGNSVCADTYLNAVQEYRAFCTQNAYACVPVFTTSPVDAYDGENACQREIKHDYMRTFVQQDANRVLFDYADILCWNDAGEQHLESWTDYEGSVRQFAHIHPDNDGEYDGGDGSCHIGATGCIRLAKAMWWMLARLAGWDDGSSTPTATVTQTGTPPTPSITPEAQVYLPVVKK